MSAQSTVHTGQTPRGLCPYDRGMWDWNIAVNVADVVTAICAVIGVVIAVWLGLKAIVIAQRDTDRGMQEFVATRVDAVLDEALSFVSAAEKVATTPVTRATTGEVAAHFERLTSKLRVLTALELVEERSEASVALVDFASTLHTVALMAAEPQKVLRESLIVFDAAADACEILDGLAWQLHGRESYTDPTGYVFERESGRGISDALDGDPDTAYQLYKKARDKDAGLTINEALRLLLPTIYDRLGWLYFIQPPDELPNYVMWKQDPPSPEQRPEELPTEREKNAHVSAWLEAWPRHRWRRQEDHHEPSSLDAVLTTLIHDLRNELIDRVVALVVELRSAQFLR